MENIKTRYFSYKDCEELLNKPVKIVSNSVKRYKDYDLPGRTGEIVKTRCTTGSPCTLKSIAIRIDGLHNPASERGLFWVSPEDAILLTRKENIMNKTKTVNESCKLCVVRDVTNGATNVAVYFGNINIGDMVVCDYYRSNKKLSVRHVVDVINDTKDNVYCQVLGTVDTSAYDDAITRIMRRKELESMMKARAAEIEDELYFAMLAEKDKNMAELYKEYKEL